MNLFDAINADDLGALQQALEQGADVNDYDFDDAQATRMQTHWVPTGERYRYRPSR